VNNTSYQGTHSQDGTVLAELDGVFTDRDYPYSIEFSQRRYEPWDDFLVVTQSITGSFVNVGPTGIDEVVQANLKDVLKSGEGEEKAREVMSRELGRWIQSVDRIPWN